MGRKVNWFFEKVNGRQFHALYSECDNFSVRLQIRKKKSYSWFDVAKILKKTNYLNVFKNPGVCTKDETRLIASYREREGIHKYCQWGQKKKSENFHIDLSSKENRIKLLLCLKKLAG